MWPISVVFATTFYPAHSERHPFPWWKPSWLVVYVSLSFSPFSIAVWNTWPSMPSTHRTLYCSSSFAEWCSRIGRQPPALVGSKLGWMDKMAGQMMAVRAPRQIELKLKLKLKWQWFGWRETFTWHLHRFLMLSSKFFKPKYVAFCVKYPTSFKDWSLLQMHQRKIKINSNCFVWPSLRLLCNISGCHGNPKCLGFSACTLHTVPSQPQPTPSTPPYIFPD